MTYVIYGINVGILAFAIMWGFVLFYVYRQQKYGYCVKIMPKESIIILFIWAVACFIIAICIRLYVIQ